MLSPCAARFSPSAQRPERRLARTPPRAWRALLRSRAACRAIRAGRCAAPPSEPPMTSWTSTFTTYPQRATAPAAGGRSSACSTGVPRNAGVEAISSSRTAYARPNSPRAAVVTGAGDPDRAARAPAWDRARACGHAAAGNRPGRHARRRDPRRPRLSHALSASPSTATSRGPRDRVRGARRLHQLPVNSSIAGGALI